MSVLPGQVLVPMAGGGGGKESDLEDERCWQLECPALHMWAAVCLRP